MFDFPASPTTGQQITMADGTVRTWDGVKWRAGGTQVGLADAPADGTMYGRISNAWQSADTRYLTQTTGDARYVNLAGGETMTGVLNLWGTRTNDNAAAGYVGEVLALAITANVAMTTNTAVNVGTLSLTAGDWDVDGMVQIAPSAAPTVMGCAINTTSATMPAAGNTAMPMQRLTLSFTSAATQIFRTGRARISLAATTNVYLIGIATFASGTCNAQGYISARRRR